MDTPNFDAIYDRYIRPLYPTLTRFQPPAGPLGCSGDIHCPLWAGLGVHPPYRPPCTPRGHFLTWIAEAHVPHVRAAALHSGQPVWCGEAVHPFLRHVAPLYSQAVDLTPFWDAYHALASGKEDHDDT